MKLATFLWIVIFNFYPKKKNTMGKHTYFVANARCVYVLLCEKNWFYGISFIKIKNSFYIYVK
jgi:hypothetical protein